MLEEIIQDNLQHVKAQNQQIFDTSQDYEAIIAHRTKIIGEWNNFSIEERQKYNGRADYEVQNGVIDLRDPSLIPAKNFYLVRK